MAIPLNDWYTIKSGDTLSKIAAEAGCGGWQIIYNDPHNDQFRKKRPDPNLIYPGDVVWIPGPSKAKTSTGKKTVFVVPAEKIQVIEIFFDSEAKIHYVRLAAKHTDYLAPGVPASPGYQHYSIPKVFPTAGSPHWRYDAATSQPSESWPTLLIRDGSPASAGAKRGLQVSFEASVPFDGDRIIKAETKGGEIVIGEKNVTFSKGKATNVSFTFTKLPGTVDKLSNISLTWYSKKNAADSFSVLGDTLHTIYTIDEKPLKANLRAQDMYLFEIIDWSCTWARGKSGLKAVLDAIWKEFHPVKSNHATGLVYWKNWRLKIDPQQTIDLAIRSQDDPDPLSRNAASCVVFDNIFINCVLIQGIKAAEIRIEPSSASITGFIRGGIQYSCQAFNASSVKGQGNIDAPPSWQSHWIADVFDSLSTWKIYDASYGAAAYDSNDPTVNNPVDVLAYEKVGVKSFYCYNFATGSTVDLKAGATPAEPPHLTGTVLWKPPAVSP